MIFVDSSVWIQYFNGETTWQALYLDNLLEQELIATGDLILTEVLQGFRSDMIFRRAIQLFSPLPFYTMLGRDIAIQSAHNYRILRKNGVTVRKTIDVMIATFCIANHLPLLHSDRDFYPMENYLKLPVIKHT